MKRPIAGVFTKKLAASQKLQQRLVVIVMKAIVDYLKDRPGEMVRYWGMLTILEKELLTNSSSDLREYFGTIFDKAVAELDNRELVYKGYAAHCGGYLMFPYKRGFKVSLAEAQATAALAKMVTKIQYS